VSTALSAQEELPLRSSDAQERNRNGIKSIAHTGLFASQQKQTTHTQTHHARTHTRIDAYRNDSHPSSNKQNLYRQRNAA